MDVGVAVPREHRNPAEIRGEPVPAFTIFIPSYNRAYCLGRALQSVADSTCKDLEVVLIDDGSTDATRDLVAEWQQRALFRLRYIYQENAGKAAAHNRAVEAARGFMFLTLDSDDSLLPDALEQVLLYWEAIAEDRRPEFAGIGGLLLEEDGTVSGTRYARDVIDSDFLEIRSFGKVHGDKREAIRTDVLREFPYPMIPGEKHVRPDFIFRRIGHRYKTRFVNTPLVIGRREADGISHNRRRLRERNPKGLHLAFLEEITLHDAYTDRRQLQRLHARYVRFALHSGIGPLEQFREVKHKLRWLAALPAGIGAWLGDKLRRLMPSQFGRRKG
jgi:glycosyltransferase involved in cell wall biosynthesis